MDWGTYVTNALGFFSTAYTNASRPDLSIADKARETKGPRPAPATHMILRTSLLQMKVT